MGSVLWAREISSPDRCTGAISLGFSVRELPDGGIVFPGPCSACCWDVSFRPTLYKITSDGELEWVKKKKNFFLSICLWACGALCVFVQCPTRCPCASSFCFCSVHLVYYMKICNIINSNICYY